MDRSTAQAIRPPVEREKIRVGVIGTRFGAKVHVPALRKVPGIDVVALCGSHERRTRDAAVVLGIPHAFDNYRDLFASGEIDAVSIAAPPYLHHHMVLTACEFGIHILCEKPMARNAAEARDMVRMARETGVSHAVAYARRYEPVRQKMKALVESGFLGQIHSVSVIVYRATLADQNARRFSWLMEREKGGGITATVGSHFVDALRWWFGEIHWVAGAVSTAVDQRPSGQGGTRIVDADDNSAFVMRFANGAIGSVAISYTAATDVGEEIVVSGSEGMLAVQEPGRLIGTQRGEKIRNMMDAPPPPAGGESRNVLLLGQQMTDWVRAMRAGVDADPSFEDGAKVQEVVDAVSRSMQLSRWIDLSGNKWPV